MKPEKALEIADDALTKALKTSLRARKAFDKKLGRLKLVEEMMRVRGMDLTFITGSLKGSCVAFDSDIYASILSELQGVIAEIEGDMAYEYTPKKEIEGGE